MRIFASPIAEQSKLGELLLQTQDNNFPYEAFLMQTMQSNTATATVLPAAGQDVPARLTAWATPVTKVDMSNLNFAMAQRRVASDEKASDMLATLLRNMAQANALRERAKAAVREIKDSGRWAQRDGEAIYYAREVMAQMQVEKTELRNETLAYCRLLQKLKRTAAGGERDELAKQVAATKKGLDDKRVAHDVAMATTKAQLESAEEELRWFSDDARAIQRVIKLLQEQESDFGQARSIRKQLEVDLNDFEEYVARLG